MTLKVGFYPLPPPNYVKSKNTIFSLRICWLLAKNLSNFVTLPGELDNPYYHNVWFKNHSTFLEIWLRNRNWCIFSQYGPMAMLQKLPSIQNSTKAQTKYFWYLNIDPLFSNFSNQSWAIFDLIVWTMISKCVESL